MNISVSGEQWQPAWSTHPGEHLAEYIELNGWSQAEFARLAGVTPKLVSTILNKSNPVTPETAIKLERVLGVKAYVWTNLQANWDLHLAQTQEAEKAKAARNWLSQFPLSEIRGRCGLPEGASLSDLLNTTLTMLGIGSPEALHSKLDSLAVHHRRALNQEVSELHVLTWLMLGERQAQGVELPPFDETRFKAALDRIRTLTVMKPEDFEPVMKEECRLAGVALVFEKPIKKTCLYGSARWMSSERAIIQMSLRMKSNDHFWWTFFHEAGHLLLHKGKNFADDQNARGDGLEDEADRFAERMLVNPAEFSRFVASKPRSKAEVVEFAGKVGIHPGIVVGMLQHRRVISYNYMNDLKARFLWSDEVAH